MMKLSPILRILLFTLVSVWLVACAPADMAAPESNAASAQTFAETSSSAGTAETATTVSAAGGETLTSAGDTVTSDQPDQEGGSTGLPSERATGAGVSPAAGSDQSAGETPGNSGSAEAPSDVSSAGADTMTNLDVAAWLVYTDATYGFRVLYPPAFAVEPAGGGDVLFGATAIATVSFVDTQNEQAEIAPSPFVVRVFAIQPGQSLNAWLESNGVIGGGANVETKPFRTDKLEGIRVTSLDFMAPGWSVFVLRGERVYQLVPLGEEGETMLATFEFL